MKYSLLLWLFIIASIHSIKAQQITWATQLGDIGYDRIDLTTTDANANVYVAGVFSDTLTTDGGIIISDGSNSDVFFGQYSANGEAVWLKRLGGDGFDRVTAMNLAPSNHLYLAGTVIDTVRFGTDTIVTKGHSDSDIYLTKVDAIDGSFVWTREIETALEGSVADIGTDALGNVFVWGSFQDTLALGTDSLLTFGQSDLFLLKYDSNGNLLWKNHFGGSKNDLAVALRVSDSGDLYLSGTFNGKILLGSTFLEAYDNLDSFVARYDSEGNLVWAKQLGSDQLGALVTDLAFDNNHIFITGTYVNNTLINGQTIMTDGLQSLFVARFLLDGTPDFVRGFNNDLVATPTQMVCDNNGRLYISGILQGTAQFGAYSLSSSNSENGIAICLSSETGDVYGAMSFGGNDYDATNSICVANGKCFVGGAFAQSATFGTNTFTSAGNLDAFLLQINQDVINATPLVAATTTIWKTAPNPANTSTRLQLPNATEANTYTLSINNLLGQTMWSGSVANSTIIDTNQWQSGVYVMQLFDNHRHISRQMLIVQH